MYAHLNNGAQVTRLKFSFDNHTSIARLSICSNMAGDLYNCDFLVSGGSMAGLMEWS